MKKRAIAGATVSLALLTSASATTSQDSIHYESPWELVGAALIRPRAVEKILVDTGTTCAKLKPTLAPLAAEALEGWHSRNGPYLLRSAHYRKDLQKTIEAKPDSEQSRGLRQLVGPEVDSIVLSLADRTVGGFKKDLDDNPAAGEQLCRGYLGGAKDGKLDLKIRDPEVAQFLDKVSVQPSPSTGQQ
ncbi:hypothetical protein [Cupriavidus sp. 2SB]|uniref:hypothetical protein n=1 Tax=Cupriavidus sp. 2SB TaxID=2502199 RepID=UPI0010F80DA7|nr:hypothetical protein [Cupriavidus sp. 2SB]